mmetsp:Transcript_105544/g.340035  ORF Transcript_105544/g.340035 Transcript_105544/m.340035 type:complete len:1371 (-) Transcript_105544:81-4193(-)
MPEESFLQQFHNLAGPDEEVRCKAALAVRQALSTDGGDTDQDNLRYAVKRLVRGVQSSRQCARQGFSLALAEVLVAFPDELAGVLTLITQLTQLQSGLKANEQKERLLGRLFAYIAVRQSGCLCRPSKDSKVAKSSVAGMLKDLGTGLHEVYTSRSYLRGPAAELLTGLCHDLCEAGLAAELPALLQPWALDDAMRGSEDGGNMFAAGIIWKLRTSCIQPSNVAMPRKGLPDCITKDTFASQQVLEKYVRSLATELSSTPFSDELPFALAPFCHWWSQSLAGQNTSVPQSRTWRVFDEVLFPEKAGVSAQAHGFRALAEIMTGLCSVVGPAAGENHGEAQTQTESLIIGLFEHMPRGLGLLLRTLTWQRAQTHIAAVFAHDHIVRALGASKGMPSSSEAKLTKQGQTQSVFVLSDVARLSILAALQQHVAFGVLPNVFQKQWHQVLSAPLSPSGVHTRFSALMNGLRNAGVQKEKGHESVGGSAEQGAVNAKSFAAQLEHLTVHGRAPDEVILASLCFLFGMSYVVPNDDEHLGVRGFSLRSFCASIGLTITQTQVDLFIPVQLAGRASTSKERVQDQSVWRSKFWSTLSGLVRRPLPDLSEKLVAGGTQAHASNDKIGSDGSSIALVRTSAFHGCLNDGSLLVMRLHEWWDYLATGTPSSEEVGTPSKKARKKGSSGVVLSCSQVLDDSDVALRKRCIELCRSVLSASDHPLAPRQRNALCNLPLCIALFMVGVEDVESKLALREHLQELETALGKLVAASTNAQSKQNKSGKVQKAISEALTVVPRIAAELFVNGSGLVKEAARAAWRELGDFIPAETLSSLCASVRGGGDLDADDDNEDKNGDEDEDDDDDEADDPNAAAKTEQFERATAALKLQREAEKASHGANDDPAGSDDDIVLMDTDTMFQQLLGENEGKNSKSLLTSFADSGLDDADANGQKMSKRQKRLRQRQEDVLGKFRELELLEVFLTRFGDKKNIGVEILQELYSALAICCRRAARSAGAVQNPDEDSSKTKRKGKKVSRVDNTLRQLEATLAQRIAKVLQKALRHVSGPSAISKIAGWHDADDWAKFARTLFADSLTSKVASAGQRPIEVGSLLLYFFCAAHHAAAHGAANEAGWEVADEIALTALQDWSSKKDCERWCEGVLTVFAGRIPSVLLKLPWLEHIRSCSSRPFVQRAQVSFLANRLSQPLPKGPASEGTVQLAEGFAELCADLLESTLKDDAADAIMSASHKHKLRREGLKGLKAAMKTRTRRGETAAATDDIAKRMVKVATKVRDALPARRGEVYQLCLHVLRSLPQSNAGASTENKSSKEQRLRTSSDDDSQGAKRRRDQASTNENATAVKKTKVSGPKSGPQVAKGNKTAFKDM